MAKTKQWGRWVNTGEPPKEGGQGRVFFVLDGNEPGAKKAALKELKNPRRLERFAKEIRAFVRLGLHPNLIVIIDSRLDELVEKPYYVMEIADASLEDIIGTLSADTGRALELFEGICTGVAHLHSNGILHRDIKPANILLIGSTPKVSDLGLCLIASEERITPSDEAVGPRYFMAPELENGRNPDVDVRADVYSLGKLLYYLLTTGRVYSREDRYFGKGSLATAHVDVRFKPFDSLLRKSITEKPTERYASAVELLDAFHKACNAYFGHPRSTLIKKLGDPLAFAKGLVTEQLASLNAGEQKEFLLLMNETGTRPSVAVLEWFSQRSAGEHVQELMSVVCPLIETLPNDLSSRLAANIMKHDGAWTPMGVRCTGKQREMLVYKAIVDAQDVDVLRAAAHHQFPGQPMPSVPPEIQKRFDGMALEDRQAFVLLTINMNWEGKCEWLALKLNQFRVDEILFEGALCSLFKLGDDAIQAKLVKLGSEIHSEKEVGMYGRAMIEYAARAVLDQIAQTPALDPRLRILLGMRQKVESDEDARTSEEE